MKRPPKSIGGLAVHWRVGEATIKRWRAKGAPLHDDRAAAQWVLSQRNMTPAAAARARQLMGDAPADTPGASPPTPRYTQSEWDALVKQAELEADRNPQASLVSLKRASAVARFLYERAAMADNRADMKFYREELMTFEGLLHDALLRAKKLNLDAGELLPRAEVERIIFALGFWLMRCVDLQLDVLTSRLRTLSAELPAEPVRTVLEAELLNLRVLEPMARAAKIAAGVSLPEWVVAKMRQTCGDYLENGEAAFVEITEGSRP